MTGFVSQMKSVEIKCKTAKNNPIFGALYRHPVRNVAAFTSYLGEFLECFSANGTTLTLMGDLNIDLNKTNTLSLDYF